jgi:hypothetical protein
MRDAPEKTRFAVQMAIAARALVGATSDPHRKRVIGRYVFVYLHDVIRFAAHWRNTLARASPTRPAADSALPALQRLRQDWDQYQNVRHFIGAKRQVRDRVDAAVDQLESFRLWTDIGELSVGALVEDAVELYVQLSSVSPLPPVDLAPSASFDVVAALATLDAVGEAGLLEIAASSFSGGRANTFPVRQGGEVGRLVPLLNDVAENIQTLCAIAELGELQPPFNHLVRCQLPSEIDELLRLSLGPSPGAPLSTDRSLLELYLEPGKHRNLGKC